MKYIVKRIEEDLDFGCEEREEDVPIMAVVTLWADDGRELKVRQPDQMLYDRNIDEGDVVVLDEKQWLKKLQ